MDTNKLLDPKLANEYKTLVYNQPHKAQQKILQQLITSGTNTKFGRDHKFATLKSSEDFNAAIKTTDYPYYQEYIDMILRGDSDVLWPGRPLYLASTSGSTGEPKYIPVTKESISSFISMPIRALLQYIYDERDYDLLNHHLLNFTDGSIRQINNIYSTGSISAYCRQMMPSDLIKQSLPSKYAVDLIDAQGWDAMFKQTADEVKQHSISVCTGVPSWLWQFFSICKNEFHIDNLSEILPKLRVICSSGVSLRPYQMQLQSCFEQKLNFREFYSASEGAFAYQDCSHDSSMLLNLADGIYFEFIELEYCRDPHAIRRTLSEVKSDIDYVPVVTTNAGLWAYKLTDIIRFTTTNPYRVEIVGRTNHFISIFLEDVYSRNVEDALSEVSSELGLKVNNFTVAPSEIKEDSKPFYEWYLELDEFHDINKCELAFKLDYHLKKFSFSYSNARNKAVLNQARLYLVKKGAFVKLLEKKNVTSLQLKVPKVQNNREIVDYFRENNMVLNVEQFA